jgi:dextranase
MQILDFYPSLGSFRPGSNVHFTAEIVADEVLTAKLRVSLSHLADEMKSHDVTLQLVEGQQEYQIELPAPSEVTCGFGVEASLITENGQILAQSSTAFDLQDNWTEYPRYGFLSDFYPQRQDIKDCMSWLMRFHINGLQFYDWQFRHDALVSPSETYQDPLKRSLSLNTIRAFIHEAHEHRIASMLYLAIYAASLEFWSDHPEWRLMDEKQQPILFEDFLGIMDPSSDQPWITHLLDECERARTELSFTGLHIDQYGEPKTGFRITGEEVDIPEAFHDFVSLAKRRFPNAPLTFNAVNNWPIDVLATSNLDFNYIEIWPPTPKYDDLRQIVYESRRMSGNKPVVIALYLPSGRIHNILLANAIILACGGSRIELGENKRILTDPYFPKHEGVSLELEAFLRQYYDFAVRYVEFIGPAVEDDDEVVLSLPEDVWGITRKTRGWRIIHLINTRGLDDKRWDEDHAPPIPLNPCLMKISTSEKVQQIFWASPDTDDLSLKPADWLFESSQLHVTIPHMEFWTTVAVQIEGME